MHAELEFAITSKYKSFTGRLLQFVKSWFWLYIPDSVLILILILPPYSFNEFLLVITALIVLGFRDIVLMKRMARYLQHFTVENAMVNYSIIYLSHTEETRQVHIAKVNLVLQKSPFSLKIFEESKLIHRQYAIGYWTKDKLRDLHDNFNDLKKDIDMEVMFRGVSIN